LLAAGFYYDAFEFVWPWLLFLSPPDRALCSFEVAGVVYVPNYRRPPAVVVVGTLCFSGKLSIYGYGAYKNVSIDIGVGAY